MYYRKNSTVKKKPFFMENNSHGYKNYIYLRPKTLFEHSWLTFTAIL